MKRRLWTDLSSLQRLYALHGEACGGFWWTFGKKYLWTLADFFRETLREIPREIFQRTYWRFLHRDFLLIFFWSNFWINNYFRTFLGTHKFPGWISQEIERSQGTFGWISRETAVEIALAIPERISHTCKNFIEMFREHFFQEVRQASKSRWTSEKKCGLFERIFRVVSQRPF